MAHRKNDSPAGLIGGAVFGIFVLIILIIMAQSSDNSDSTDYSNNNSDDYYSNDNMQRRVNEMLYKGQIVIADQYVVIVRSIFPKLSVASDSDMMGSKISLNRDPYFKAITVSYGSDDNNGLAFNMMKENLKVSEINFQMSRVFNRRKFAKFRKVFLRNKFGGGTTQSGRKIPASRAYKRGASGIIHKEFKVRFKKRIKTESYEVRIKRKGDRLIDEDNPIDPYITKTKERKVFAGWEIEIRIKNPRNSLARKLLRKSLTALREVIIEEKKPEPVEKRPVPDKKTPSVEEENRHLIPPD